MPEITKEKKELIHLPLDKCQECPLYNEKTHNPHNWYGNPEDPDIFIMGEAPGMAEQKTGKAFQGRAGKLLEKELKNVDINNVFVSNSVLCRPTEFDEKRNRIKDRKPTKKELECCFSNIEAQLNHVKPKVIVPLGATATQRLGVRGTITKQRGNKIENDYGTIIPTFHPAYILRAPQNKEMFVSDLQYVKSQVDGEEEKKGDYKIIKDINEFKWVIDRLNEVDEFAFDIETTGFYFYKHDILGIGFSWKKYTGVYIPLIVGGEEYWANSQLSVIDDLKRVMENSAKKYAHNGKFDVKFINHHWDCNVKNFSIDTMLLHYILDENTRHGLKELSDTYYRDLRGYSDDLKSNITQTKMDAEAFGSVPLDVLGPYCAMDCDATFRLAKDLSKRLTPALKKLLDKFYMPLTKAYIKAETDGVQIDVKYIEEKIVEYTHRIKDLEAEIYMAAGRPFNINSPKQMQEVLFNELGYKPTDKTATGGYSTGEGALKKMRDKKGIVNKILELRGRKKMVSTYFESLLEKVDGNGRIHPSFLLHGTVTGRLSSRNPNITNIPRDTDVKGLFIPAPNYYFVEFDYSQAELRTVAWYAQDKTMMQEYIDEVDLHTATAATMFKKEPDEVSKRERKIAKAIAFGTLYGGGPSKIKESVNARLDKSDVPITVPEAIKFQRFFFDKYKGIDKWIKKIHRYAHKNKQVINCFGRIRRLPTIKSNDEGLIKEAERQSCNSLIQSTASDIAQLAAIKIFKYLIDNDLKSRFLFTVHDAIVLEIHKDEYEELRPKIIEMMESPPAPFDMAIKADEDFYRNRWGID